MAALLGGRGVRGELERSSATVLRRLRARVDSREQALEAARRQLADAVADASADGASTRSIGAAVGHSHVWVSRLLAGGRAEA